MPSSCGMRMSMRTTSGRCRSTAPSTSRPSAASATTSSVRRAGEHHPQAGAHERVVVDEQDADHRARQPGAQDERAVGVDAVLELAAGERDALGQPDQAGPRPGQRAGRADRHRREAADLDVQPAVGRADGERHGRARRVLAGVRQALLRDPVGGAADGGGRRRVAELDRRGDPHPGRPRLLDERGEVGERRLRRLRQALAAVLAQHADHAAQLVERGPRALADHAGRRGDLLGRSVGVELERAGVDGEQREAVGEHVVHLARDPPPLGRARLVRGAVGLRAQRAHELAPRAHEEPPADHDAGHQQAGRDVGPVAAAHRRVVGVGG